MNVKEKTPCDICFKTIKDKVTLECKHELCIACFLEITSGFSFKCYMCRRQYNWKEKEKEKEEVNLIDSLVLLIREDETNMFIPLFEGNKNKAFEVIIQMPSIPIECVIQFIVILDEEMDTELLKFLISEFVVREGIENTVTDGLDNIIENFRGISFSHFRNIDNHLESFYDNLIIKRYHQST